MTADTDRSAGGLSDPVLLAFVRLWAMALLLHVGMAERHRIDSVWAVAVVGLSFAVLLRPRSVGLFTALLLAQLLDMVAEMPFSPSHWMLDGFVGLTILLTFLARREISLDSLRAAVPGMRIVLLVAYSAAAIAKHNSTFLDPVTSCASAIASRASLGLSDRLPLDPVWVAVTIGVETAVPLLLLLPATRRHGVRLGIVFHVALTLSPAIGVMDFSTTLIALFLLFLSSDDADRLLRRLRWIGERSAVVRDVTRFPVPAAVLGFAAVGLLGYLSVSLASATTGVLSRAILLAIAVAAIWTWRSPADAARLGSLRWIHLPCILLTLVWALSPYLGLRTTATFNMFSSLRTEGTEGNHLFLPNVHLVDWQDDLIYVRASNDPAIDRAARKDVAIPLLGLRALAMQDPDLEVTGVLHGDEIVFGPEPGQRHLEPLPWWQWKLAHFHAIPVGSQRFCVD